MSQSPILPPSEVRHLLPIVKPKACVPCRTRKVKCDKKSPCGNCISWSLVCVFPSPVRRCHRPRKTSNSSLVKHNSTLEASEQLEKRLKNLEDSLQQLTTFVKWQKSGTPIGGNTEQVIASDTPSTKNNKEQLDAIESRVGEIATEIATKFPSASLSDSTDDLLLPTTLSPWNSFNLDTSALHPSPTQAQTIWDTFKESADQQVKVVNRKFAEKILMQAVNDPAMLGNDHLSLILAIYFASVVSMTPETALRCFNIPKETAVTVFRSAAERALMKANFIYGTNLTVLQALILFIVFSKHVDNDQCAWTLTGLAKRLNSAAATRIRTPFEMETQRRIWWQLWYLDFRAAANDGKSDGSLSAEKGPELPVNLYDDDLYPNIPLIPSPRDDWTPITFSLIRFILARTARQVDGSASLRRKITLIDECWNHLQSKYLKHCIGTEPIHWLARHIAYVHVAEMRMSLYTEFQPQLFQAAKSTLDLNYLIFAATDILDVPTRLHHEPEAHRWEWQLSPFPHFVPLSFLLDQVARQQIHPPLAQTWTVAERALLRADNERPTIENMQLLKSLMTRAKTAISSPQSWQNVPYLPCSNSQPRESDRSNTSESFEEAFIGFDSLSGPGIPNFDWTPLDSCLFFEDVEGLGSMDDLDVSDTLYLEASE